MQKLTKAIARHAKIRDQNPSFGMICPGEPYQRSPNAPKPEEREFVVDPGTSMDMIRKKDLNDAEMDTLTKSCSPTIVIVITANGEVQTHEEATV